MTKPSLSEQLAPYSRPMYSPYDEETGEGLERPEPTMAEVHDEYAAPSRAAEHPYGIIFRADHETEADGMCRQARLHARALAAHVPVVLHSIGHRVRHGDRTFPGAGDDLLAPNVWREIGRLRHTTIQQPLVTVYHTVVHRNILGLLLPDYSRYELGAADRILARSIVYTPWERSIADPNLCQILKRCGQVWLQCERNKAAFVTSGLPKEKVRLIPNAYDPGGAVPAIAEDPSVPSGKRFYNIGKWEPRKGQHALIGAFLMAFGPKEKASLTIKTSHFGSWQDYPSPTESLRYWMQHPEVRQRGWTPENLQKRLMLVEGTVSDSAIVELHRRNNIYVSASHAEGWDYPAFDAKTAGNRLVHVGFGGSEDYADETDIMLKWKGLEPVHSGYRWEEGAMWAAYDVSELARCLRSATPPGKRWPREDLARRYGDQALGRVMFEAISQLVVQNDPEIAGELWGAK